jgi:AcrR family transcriptional regulator
MSRPTHRHALLAAAKQLLREKGYARTTARDLVAASGTNLASIGYHFGSKEALLNEAIAESFGEWTERLERVAMADESLGPAERLMTSMRAVMDSFDEMRPFFVACLEALAQAERSDDLRAQLAHNYDLSRRQVGEAVAQALPVEGDDAETIASLIIALTDGLFIQAFLDRDRTPRPDDFAAAIGRALTGIEGGPAVAP